MKRTTILDVAKLANVSTATVSRVVSGSNLISEKTKGNCNGCNKTAKLRSKFKCSKFNK